MIIEPESPTIDETIAGFKAMAASIITPKVKVKRAHLFNHILEIDPSRFEKCRPTRSSEHWLTGAPQDVVACYDGGETATYRYIVAFGGSMWSARYAYRNWKAGLNPYITPCLKISVNDGVSACWDHRLLTRKLGLKMHWNDLAPSIRHLVIEEASAFRKG